MEKKRKTYYSFNAMIAQVHYWIENDKKKETIIHLRMKR